MKCTHCGRTHALIPEMLVPYSLIPVEAYWLLAKGETEDEDCTFPLSSYCLPKSTRLSILSRIRHSWSDILACCSKWNPMGSCILRFCGFFEWLLKEYGVSKILKFTT